MIRSRRLSPAGRARGRLQGGRLGLWVVVAAAGMFGVVTDSNGGEPVEAVPPIDLPQIRINDIDTSAFPKVRVRASILDRAGRPVQVKAINKLAVIDGRDRTRDPLIRFNLGKALDGRKDGKIWPADKAGNKVAAVLVVAGYQATALRDGSLGRRVKEAAGTLLKPFGKTDRVNVIWYADRLARYVGLMGRTNELADIETSRDACGEARAEAISGGPVTGGPKADKPPAPGTDLCGLAADVKAVDTIVKGAAFEGYYPRLFNLGAPFYSHKRYCKVPDEALKSFGQITPENTTRRLEERERRRLQGKSLDWETSAFDEALRLLIQDGRADEEKVIIVLSDGRDGYWRDLDNCRQNPPRECTDIPEKQHGRREACVRAFLDRRIVREQTIFKARAEHWIGVARAARIRVFAIGLGMLGEPFELARLRLLAERTGGTYRSVGAGDEEQIGVHATSTAAEVIGQLVIDFVHQEPEAVYGQPMGLKLEVDLEPTMVRGRPHLVSPTFVVDVATPPTLRTRLREGVRDVLISAQEALGYKLYVVTGIAIMVIVGLLMLLILFFVVRKIVRLFGRSES